jgi:hypothetical protein
MGKITALGCSVELLTLLVTSLLCAAVSHAQASTCADPARTIQLSGAAACRTFDQDPSSCARAWATTQTSGASVSCFYVPGTSPSCQGCGPANQASGACTNTCVAASVPAVGVERLGLAAVLLMGLGMAAARGLPRRQRAGATARLDAR